jgi:hypothetical protein
MTNQIPMFFRRLFNLDSSRPPGGRNPLVTARERSRCRPMLPRHECPGRKIDFIEAFAP